MYPIKVEWYINIYATKIQLVYIISEFMEKCVPFTMDFVSLQLSIIYSFFTEMNIEYAEVYRE